MSSSSSSSLFCLALVFGWCRANINYCTGKIHHHKRDLWRMQGLLCSNSNILFIFFLFIYFTKKGSLSLPFVIAIGAFEFQPFYFNSQLTICRILPNGLFNSINYSSNSWSNKNYSLQTKQQALYFRCLAYFSSIARATTCSKLLFDKWSFSKF